MDKICEFCSLPFESNRRSAKYCSEICKEKYNVVRLNKKWEQKEILPYTPKPLDEAERFHYGYAYKKSEPKSLKRFQAVRG